MTVDSRIAMKVLIPIITTALALMAYAENKFAPLGPTQESLSRIETKVDRLLFELIQLKSK